MTREEDNTAILKHAYSAWHKTRGDWNVWMDILADHISFGSLADGKPGMDFTKYRASKQEVIGYFEGLANDWEMEFYHINEFVAQGDRVVAIGECSWTHRRNGNTISIPKVDIWKFEDGKATQFMEYYDTHAVLQAAQE